MAEELEMSKKTKEIKSDKRKSVLKLYSVGTSIILIVILVVFNILFENILGNYLNFDFSLSGQNSVSQKTIDYLDSLPEGTNLRIVGLFEKPDSLSNSPLEYICPLLDSYVKAGKGKVSVEYTDPEKYPSIMTQIDPQGVYDLQKDTFAVTDGKKVVIIDPINCFTYDQQTYEQQGVYLPVSNTVEYTFDNALYNLTSGFSAKAYFVGGLKNDASNQLKKILSSMGFETADLMAASEFTVPDDCDILFICGANIDIPEGMVNPIKNYLYNKGRLIVSTEYNSDNSSVSFANLNLILNEYNINIEDTLLADYNPSYALSNDGLYSLVDVASDFAVLTSAKQLKSSYARPLRVLNNPSSSVVNQATLTTSSNAVTLVSKESTNTYNVGMYGTYKDDPNAPKLYVFGTTAFTSDDYISAYGYNDANVEFTRGCVRDLVGMSSENALNIESKKIDDYSIDATKATSSNATIMTVVFMVVVPLALVIAATVVYNLRKNL